MRPHLASLVEDFRRHHADIAVVDHRGNRRYPTTYGQLALLAGRFSALLAERSIAPGDRVLIWGGNSTEWIAAFFGCLLRGVIAVPLDAAGSPEFAARIVADVKPKLITGDRDLIVQLDAEVQKLETEIPKLAFTDFTQRLPTEPLYAIEESIALETPFQIVFTSGTTSEPKGIVHTHRNVLASLQPIENGIAKYRRYERIFHPLRFLHSLPLSHVFGQFMGLWIPAVLAAELHFSDRLEPARIISLTKRERISVLIAVPRVLQLLQAHLLTRFPSLAQGLIAAKGMPVHKRWWLFRRVHSALGWKFWAVISGGATLPADLEDFYQRLGLALIQGYGLTETAALVTLNHPFHIGRGTIGKTLPGREVRLSPEGEIQVRGDVIATSIWQGGLMRARAPDWLATGDLASRNDAGELRFLGRISDVIVTASGLNIHPADLEAALASQPGMREAAIVSVTTAQGPEPAAVVLFSGTDAQLNHAIAAANSTLADFQQIRRVLRWPLPQLPRTSTGKLLRREVAAWAQSALTDQRTGQSSSSTANDLLLSLITQITGEQITESSDTLRLSEDLHLDSLGRVQLQSTIEQQLHIDIPDDAINTATTLGDLRALLTPESATTPSGAPSSPQPSASETATRVGLPATKPTAPISAPAEESLYPTWPWSWPIQLLRSAFLETILRPLVWLLAAPKVTRPADLPEGPALIIVNHVTTYDGALALYALPGRLRRHTASMMSAEMLLDMRHSRNQGSQGNRGNAFLNLLGPAAYVLLSALFNAFPIPRNRGFRRSFAHAGEAMDRGQSVLLFPQGTRSRGGPFAPFRAGIGLLAQQSGVPVIPIALVGLGDLYLGKSRWFRSGKLHIRIGQPILPDDNATSGQLTARFEQAMRQLLAGDSSLPKPPESNA